MTTMQVTSEAHNPASEERDYVWLNIAEEMIAGHQETARTIRFRGTPDEVESAIHSAQVALIRHRSRAVREGRIHNYIFAIVKRGDKMSVFNRPIADFRKYIHRAPEDVMYKLDALATKARMETP